MLNAWDALVRKASGQEQPVSSAPRQQVDRGQIDRDLERLWQASADAPRLLRTPAR